MTKKILLLLVALAIALGVLLIPKAAAIIEEKKIERQEESIKEQESVRIQKITAFLEVKGSPLSEEEAALLAMMPHSDLLIAISAIESQYCKHQLGYNCWGIGGDSAYRHYNNFSEAIIDANNLITRWQERGRWLTVEDMNCHYVVPCNSNWVQVVNKTLSELQSL